MPATGKITKISHNICCHSQPYVHWTEWAGIRQMRFALREQFQEHTPTKTANVMHDVQFLANRNILISQVS
jgi:hypothetical protein